MGARVLLVAEAPGETEEEKGEPLVGWSGWLVNDEILAFNGLKREDVRIENTFQCRASAASKEGRAAIACCGPSLHDVINGMPNLELILVLGEAALQEVTQYRESKLDATNCEKANKQAVKKWERSLITYEKYKAKRAAGRRVKEVAAPTGGPDTLPVPDVQGHHGISKWRGSLIYQTVGSKQVLIAPLLHPAAVSPYRQPRLRPLLAIDSRKATNIWRGNTAIPQVNYEASSDPDRLDAFLGGLTGRVALDLEWSFALNDLVCIGLGQGESYFLAWFAHPGVPALSGPVRARLGEVLQKHFDRADLQWGGHFTCGYDERKLAEKGLRLRSLWDSLYGFHLCFSDFGSPKDEETQEDELAYTQASGYDLGFVSSVLTPFAYAKDFWDTYTDVIQAPPEVVAEYCIGDVARSWWSMEAIAEEIESEFKPASKGWALLEQDIQTTRRAVAMGIAGVPIRKEILVKRLAKALADKAHFEAQARALTVADFNIASPLQLAAALTEMGCRVRYDTTTKKPKLDGNELEKLHAANPTNTLIPLVRAFRNAEKERVAYENYMPGDDGLLRVSWKVHGTTGSRWSSSPNLQNPTQEQREIVG